MDSAHCHAKTGVKEQGNALVVRIWLELLEVLVSENTQSNPVALAVSAADTAAILDVSQRHLWAMHSAGKIPKPVRLGRCVKWIRQELEDWLAAGAPSREQWEKQKGAS